MVFFDYYKNMNFPAIAHAIAVEFSSTDVERALDRASNFINVSLEERDFMALLSPAADVYLEAMAGIALDITRQRFGRVIGLYTPLYLSNTCMSICTYCGFSHNKKIKRATLNLETIQREAQVLYDWGLRQILLLTGESYRDTPLTYFHEVIEVLSKYFPSIGVEVYPMNVQDYASLRSVGLDGLAVYQETYDPVRYKELHLRGMKKRMQYRLNCADRGGLAGLRRIAVGSLLGLSDPGADAFITGLHAHYLMNAYWQTQIQISLPRLRPAAGLANIPDLSDRDYLRYLCALRLFLPDVGLNLSTRESAHMRDHLAEICITHMSAASRTQPGGYTGLDHDEQFSIDDTRGVAEICAALLEKKLEPVFVDWSSVLK